jgi:nicotinamidase-related amidase
MVIDMQTDFCGIGGYLDLMGYDISLTRRAIALIRRLLDTVRSIEGFTVIHTREGIREDLSDCPTTRGGETDRSACPRFRGRQAGAM